VPSNELAARGEKKTTQKRAAVGKLFSHDEIQRRMRRNQETTSHFSPHAAVEASPVDAPKNSPFPSDAYATSRDNGAHGYDPDGDEIRDDTGWQAHDDERESQGAGRTPKGPQTGQPGTQKVLGVAPHACNTRDTPGDTGYPAGTGKLIPTVELCGLTKSYIYSRKRPNARYVLGLRTLALGAVCRLPYSSVLCL